MPDSALVLKAHEIYLTGKSLNEVGSMFGLSGATIGNYFRAAELPIRPWGEHCIKNLDVTVFDDPLTVEAFYWLGFIYADGCVHDSIARAKSKWKRKRCLSIHISERDLSHLEKFKKFMKSDHTIYTSPQKTCEIKFGSDYLIEKLEAYGITPRKSLTACVDERLILNRDFWRGVIDGDGSLGIYVGYPTIYVCGSRNTCDTFKTFVETLVTTKASVLKKDTIWRYTVSGNAAITVIQALYNNAAASLDRKQTLADTIIRSL